MSAITFTLNNNSYGFMLSPISETLNVSIASASAHTTIAVLLAGILAPLSIRFFRRFGLRKLMLASSAMMVLAFGASCFATKVWMFNVLGIIRGVGAAFCGSAIITIIIGNWFYSEYSFFTGIAMSVSGLSSVLINPIISNTLEHYGYHATFVLYALLAVLFSLPILIFGREKPEELGIAPYISSKDDKKVEKSSEQVCAYKPKSILFAYVMLITLISVSISAFISHYPNIALWKGFGSSAGTMVLSAAMVGNVCSKLIGGALVSKFGCKKTYMGLLLFTLAGLLLMLFSKNVLTLVVGAGISGTFGCFGTVMMPTLTKEIYGLRQYDKAFGVVSIVMGVSSSSFITVIGILYDMNSSYVSSIILSCAICIVSVMMLILLKTVENRAEKFEAFKK